MRGQTRHGGLAVEGLRHGPVLLFELTPAFTLLSLNSLSLGRGQHLLVFDSKLPTLEFEVIQVVNDNGRLIRRGEIGKGKTAEDAVVKVIIESIGEWKAHISHQS